MTKKSKTLVFFGNERLVSGLKVTNAPILHSLINEGYNISAIVAHHRDSKSRTNRPLEVASIAKKYNIALLTPSHLPEIYDKLISLNAEAGVLVAYGQIIPQNIIDIFPKGIINIHPSLLPKYRGPTPIEATIANGDKKAGVSIMKLVTSMDKGPIYKQASISLKGNETKFDLYNTIIKKSTHLLLSTLPDILNESLKPLPQDSKNATYCALFTKKDSELDLSSSKKAERLVRAHLGFPKSKVTIKGMPIIVTESHVTHTPKTLLDLKCKDGTFLSVDKLIAPSGKTLSAQDFLRGYAK